MFSGVVEEYTTLVALVKDQENIHFTFRCSFVNELKIDRSISHDRVCLTVVSLTDDTYTVTAMEETLDCSNLGLLRMGDKVNVKRSMMMNGRLDKHIVQGHVGQTATCMEIKGAEGSQYFTFKYAFNEEMAKRGYITVDKDSVTVNGINLTVYSPTDDAFQAAIMPYTYEYTNFHTFEISSVVNIEFDIIGEYISRMIQYRQLKNKCLMDFLQLILFRQSDRAYDEERPVETEKLERILEAARLAPSVCSTQPWKFMVVTGHEPASKVGKTATGLGMNKFTKDAPVCILIVEKSTNITSLLGGKVESKHFPLIDTGIATTHITSAAENEGLGSCILGWFDEKEIKELTGIPASKRLLLDIAIGYPVKGEREKMRKPKEKVISCNQYQLKKDYSLDLPEQVHSKKPRWFKGKRSFP